MRLSIYEWFLTFLLSTGPQIRGRFERRCRAVLRGLRPKVEPRPVRRNDETQKRVHHGHRAQDQVRREPGLPRDNHQGLCGQELPGAPVVHVRVGGGEGDDVQEEQSDLEC